MSPVPAILIGNYVSIIDDTWPLSWSARVDVDLLRDVAEDGIDKCLLRLNSRMYPEPPVLPVTFLNPQNQRYKFTVDGGLPHWMGKGLVDVSGEILVDQNGQVKMKMTQDHQGMTGLELWNFELMKIVSGKDRLDHDEEQHSNGNYRHLLRTIFQDFSAPNSLPRKPRIDAFVIIKDGQIQFEKYLWGMDSTTPHIIASCTKSVTSLLAGIAIGQGLFGLDDPVIKHFPDVRSRWGDNTPILVRHVLSMTSGTEHTPQDSVDLLESTDIEQLVLGAKRVTEPGIRYHYDNGLPCLIGCLIERRSGMSLEQFANKHFFNLLDIRDHVWTRMPKSSRKESTNMPVLSAGGMFLTLQSFARIGQLLLQGGTYGNIQIVPKWYVEAATSQQTASSDYPYGFYFHLNHLGKTERGADVGEHLDGIDGYFALGQGQQVLFVAPKANLVIATFSSTWHREIIDRPRKWAIYECIHQAILDSNIV
ncbi:beta-lactamase/transpeptidase-like protein [Xylariales sp. PMI_506]|nr:beta-lactamase/transpeptidase-like protein [Xylariales sp. PMI_506]